MKLTSEKFLFGSLLVFWFVGFILLLVYFPTNCRFFDIPAPGSGTVSSSKSDLLHIHPSLLVCSPKGSQPLNPSMTLSDSVSVSVSASLSHVMSVLTRIPKPIGSLTLHMCLPYLPMQCSVSSYNCSYSSFGMDNSPYIREFNYVSQRKPNVVRPCVRPVGLHV